MSLTLVPTRSKPLNIAVVGTGISGMAAAWLLSQKHRVTVYEKDDRLGGHTNTVNLADGSSDTAVDTDFIVYNERDYPNLVVPFDPLVQLELHEPGARSRAEGVRHLLDEPVAAAADRSAAVRQPQPFAAAGTGQGTAELPVSSWSRRAGRYALPRILGRLEHGSLRLNLPGGEALIFGDTSAKEPEAEITIHDMRALMRLLRNGDIGFAESYLDRQWDSPDLMALMALVSHNKSALQSTVVGSRLSRALKRIYHRKRKNSRQGSRRNIAFHYDLGNAFYHHWLDTGMIYSSALFEHPEQDLALAQQAKYRRIAELAELKPGSKVLEIGCGWGGFMEHAATEWDSRVLGITLSREQLQYANKRMQTEGLEAKASAALVDYRDTHGQYDAVVSIEMLEAVGEAHWPRYFDILCERLKPGAYAVVQVITISDERYPRYRQRTDFIQRHIFPGGMLPSPTVLREQARRAGLALDHEQTFGRPAATGAD